MFDKTPKLIPLWILLGIALGTVAGYLVPGFFVATRFIGEWFVNALKFIVIPVVLISVVAGITALGDLRKLGRVSRNVLGYFVVTSAIAALLGLGLVLLLGPSEAMWSRGGPAAYPETASIPTLFSHWIPESFITSVGSGHLLGLVLFAFVFGGLIAGLGAKARTLSGFFKQAHDVMMRIVRMIVLAAPVGVFWLVGSAFASDGQFSSDIQKPVGVFLLILTVGLLIHGVVILPLILRFLGKRSIVEYLENLGPALLTAAGTGSSTATLPVMYENVTERSKVDVRSSSVVLPLGALANLNGTALFMCVASVFLCQVVGVELSFLQLLAVLGMSIAVTFIGAGVPGATMVMLGAVIMTVGLPPEALAFASGIVLVEFISRRLRAVVDVWGDAVGAAVVSESFELKLVRGGRKDRKPVSSARRGRTADRGRPTRSDRSDRGGRSRSRSPERRTSDRGRTPDRQSSSRSSRGSDRRQSDKPSERPATRQRTKADRKEDSPFAIAKGEEPMLAQLESGIKAKPTGSSMDRSQERPSRKTQPPRPRDRDSGRTQKDRSSQQSRDSRRSGEKADRSDSRPDRSSRSRQQQSPRQPQPAAEEKVPPQQEPVEAAEPKEKPVNDGRGRLSPETVARELARVSAQLGTEDEEGSDGGFAETVESVEPEAKKQPEPAAEPEFDEETTSERSEAVASELEPEPETRPESTSGSRSGAMILDDDEGEEPPVTDEPAEEEPSAPEPVKFGRGRHKRGAALKREQKAESSESSETADRPLPTQESFPTDKVSFGRGRKKRTR